MNKESQFQNFKVKCPKCGAGNTADAAYDHEEVSLFCCNDKCKSYFAFTTEFKLVVSETWVYGAEVEINQDLRG